MDVHLCKRVLKFKTSDFKAGQRACPKQPKFVRLRFLTTQRSVLKLGDVEDIVVKLCSGLLKFKRSDSTAGKRVCPKQLTFCLDYLSLTTEGIVLKGLQQSLKFEIPDPRADLEACPGPTNSLSPYISEAILKATPKPYIYSDFL